MACVKQLLAELFADSHYRFGFITYDSTVHFYNLAVRAPLSVIYGVCVVTNSVAVYRQETAADDRG